MTFKDLKLIQPILRAVEESNYTEPTPIQLKAIPSILARKDILASAQTGTGKTAAFAMPILQLIEKIEDMSQRPVLRSLILAPTRELAIQVDESFKKYGSHTNVRSTVVYGGVKQGAQVAAMKNGVHVLIATPGRLLDLINQGFIDLSTIKLLVLDEADRMLDMGFIRDIRKILSLVPEKKQTLLFSATIPSEIKKLSKQLLRSPEVIRINPEATTAETLHQEIYFTNKNLKNKLLIHILENRPVHQALLFSRTKHGADRITRDLKKKKIKSAAIHGNKSQNQRQRALDKFKNGQIDMLVATDIAARGIDIDKLQYVINYDLPNEAETYVHRIGRSGRAGEEGVAISLCEPEEISYLKDIENLIEQKINVVSDHPYPQTDRPMTVSEKKQWNKKKQENKRAYFAKRKKRR